MASLAKILRTEIAPLRRHILYPQYMYGGNLLRSEDPTLLERGGWGWRCWDVYTDILKDCHIGAVMEKRWLAVVSRELIIEAASEDAIDKKARDMVEAQLKAMGSDIVLNAKGETVASQASGFDQMCLHLLSAIHYGHAITEPMWDQDGAGEVFIKEARNRDLRRFAYQTTEEGIKLRLLTLDSLWDGEPVPYMKALIHRFAYAPTEDPYGLGLANKLFYPALFKRDTAKFWLIFADKWAQPTAVGKHPKTASPAQVDALLDMLNAIATDSGIAIPEDQVIEFLEAQRSGTVNTYKDLIDFCNNEASKTVLGETGTTDQSSGGGSRARDEVADGVRVEKAKADSDLLSETISALSRWIVWQNFGDRAKPPRIYRRFPELEEKEDLNNRATRDKVIVDMAGRQLTEQYLIDTYGVEFVKKKDGEQTTALAAALGVGGTSALMGFIQNLSQSGIPRENAISILINVFGVDRSAADEMIPPEKEPEPEQANPLETLFGGGGDTTTPAETPPVEQPPVEEEPAQLSDPLEFRAVIDRVLKWSDLNIGVEYLPGQVRFPHSKHAKKLKVGYGHLRGYVGEDKEALDCYIHPDLLTGDGESDRIFRVAQLSLDDGDLDEYKFFLGWPSLKAAKEAYIQEMSSDHFGGIEEVTRESLEQYRKAPHEAESDFAEPDEPDSADRYAEQAQKKGAKIVSGWVSQVQDLINASGSLEEVRDKLFDLYPQMDSQEFAEVMGTAMAAADFAGRYEVVQEAGLEVELNEEKIDFAELPENPTPEQLKAITLAALRNVFEPNISTLTAPIISFGKGGWKTTYKLVDGQEFVVEYTPVDGYVKYPVGLTDEDE